MLALGYEIVRMPEEKDETDSELALQLMLEQDTTHIRHDQAAVAFENQEKAEALIYIGELQRLVPSSQDVL